MRKKDYTTKIEKEIRKLVNELKEDCSSTNHIIVKMKGSALQHKYANKVFEGKFSAKAYFHLFKVREASEAGKHYIDLYYEET